MNECQTKILLKERGLECNLVAFVWKGLFHVFLWRRSFWCSDKPNKALQSPGYLCEDFWLSGKSAKICQWLHFKRQPPKPTPVCSVGGLFVCMMDQQSLMI